MSIFNIICIYIMFTHKNKNFKNKYKNHSNLKLFWSKSKWFVWAWASWSQMVFIFSNSKLTATDFKNTSKNICFISWDAFGTREKTIIFLGRTRVSTSLISDALRRTLNKGHFGAVLGNSQVYIIKRITTAAIR